MTKALVFAITSQTLIACFYFGAAVWKATEGTPVNWLWAGVNLAYGVAVFLLMLIQTGLVK